MIRVAVVDDFGKTSMAIKAVLDGYDFGINVQVDAFVSGTEMLRKEAEQHYDILILDIELSAEHRRVEENGLYLASRVKSVHPDTTIIYITGTVCHIKEVLQHEPFRYLEKPFEMGDICQAVQEAIHRIVNSADQILFFQTGQVSYGMNMKRIKYFVSNRRKITVYSVDESFDFYEKMNDLEVRISGMTECFIRVGKSYLVNAHHIMKISREEIELLDKTIVPVSRRYKDEVMRKYEKYIDSRRI